MPTRRQAEDPPAFVRLAAHPLRWRLLSALACGDHRVRDLTMALDQPQSLVSYHLRLLRETGLVTATRSSHDGRDSYYHLDLDHCAAALATTAGALHPALGVPPAPARRPRDATVLFVCTTNGDRSVIAEALLHHHTAGEVTVTSAGTVPGTRLTPQTVRVLWEDYGIDVTGRSPRHVDTVARHVFTDVITLCDKAREVCPGFSEHPRRAHWSIPDPAMADPACRHTAAEIDTRVRHLLPTLP